MLDFIFLMHNDARHAVSDGDWEAYIGRLRSVGAFQGGSAIGAGVCARKYGHLPPINAHINGYICIVADDFAHAQTLLAGNPDYEAGGTVEIRALPRT